MIALGRIFSIKKSICSFCNPSSPRKISRFCFFFASTGIFFAYYKYFDQFLQTVKNKTAILILVFKEFLQVNSTTDFCTLCEKVSRVSVEKFSSHIAEQLRRGTLLCSRKFLVSKNVRDPREGGVSRFSVENFLSHSAENFCRGTHSLISGIEKFYAYEGNITIFYRKFVVSQYRKTS